MDKSETKEAMAAIGMMLQAFPSAQSSITADSPRVYLFAVEDFSLEALKRACRAIVRGEVKDLKPEFPPAAPKLAQIVKEMEDLLKVERYEAEHLFIEEGSETWQKLRLSRGASLVAYNRTLSNGAKRRGWFFKPEEVRAAEKLSLPPPVAPEELKAIHGRLRGLGYSVGDPEGAEDAA